MSTTRTAPAVAIVLVSWWTMVGSPAADAAQDQLARAKDLYTSAAYDEALEALGDYKPAAADAIEANEYRAFCLLALGKTDEATRAIEQIITAHPSFQPPEALASPRVQEAFRTVRRRLLPAIVRQTYTSAKEAFDRSDFDAAAKEFDRVRTLLNDTDVADSGDLADLRLLSKGFGELIQKMSTPAALPAVPVASPPSSAEAVPEGDHVYGHDDPDVTPPVVISQTVPSFRPTGQQSDKAEVALVILIDETGSVASVRLQGTLGGPYDAMLRQAAARWKYQPATKNGRPVKFQKAVAIRLKSADQGR